MPLVQTLTIAKQGCNKDLPYADRYCFTLLDSAVETADSDYSVPVRGISEILTRNTEQWCVALCFALLLDTKLMAFCIL